MATINDAVREMYLTQTGREADPGGLEYFANRFGSDIDPQELAIFRQMAADEVAGQEARQAAATTAAGTGMSVADAYQQVLGRAPDAAGLQYFADRFGTSVDPTELSTFSVAAQPELAARTTTNSAIRDMYRQVLGREPDASGLQYFADRFGTSVDPTELGIFQGMASQEIAANAARNTGTTTRTGTGTTTTSGTGTGTTATGTSIADAYQQVLGRAPSAAEIAYWTSQFGSSVDPTELSTFSVAAQPERAAAPTTNDAVRQMYLSVLGREPDASGLKYFSDRFGTSIDASELGIFKGMATQEINANAARNTGTTTRTGTTTGTGTGTTTRTGTTTGTVQPITRPPPIRQVTGTQFAPAQVTNTAITGTPFNNIYQPSTMQQNAPLLSDIQAAAQSANPYASLMALTPQRTLSPAYAAQAGLTTYNTNLGGYDSSLYNPAAGLLAPSTIVGGGGADGVNNSGDQRGPGTDNTGGIPGLNIDPVALALAAAARPFLGSGVSLGPPAPVVDATFTSTQAGRDYAGTSGKSSWGKSGDADQDIGGTSSGDGGGTGEGLGAAYDKFEGGLITPRNVRGPNPPGPDDGNTNLDIGEFVIRKKAVQKYGANIFEKINAGQIPAKRLKSLLE
jgi:hypothetical protein